MSATKQLGVLLAVVILVIVIAVFLQPLVGPPVAMIMFAFAAVLTKPHYDRWIPRTFWVLAAIAAALTLFVVEFAIPISSNSLGGPTPVSHSGGSFSPRAGAPVTTTGP